MCKPVLPPYALLRAFIQAPHHLAWTSSYIHISLKKVTQTPCGSQRAFHTMLTATQLAAIQGSLCHRQYSGILSRLHRRFTELEIRRGFHYIPAYDHPRKKLVTAYHRRA